MNSKTLALGAAVALSSAALADVTVTFTNQTWSGFQFNNLNAAFPAGFVGTLTGVSVNATLINSVSFTYADDLTLYITPTATLATGGQLQVGGFSTLGAAQRLSWGSGGSSAPGTVVSGTQSVNPIVFSGLPTDTKNIWLGNGYGAQGTSGTWTGSITLIGINQVPAPGAAALLGVAGLVARRRKA